MCHLETSIKILLLFDKLIFSESGKSRKYRKKAPLRTAPKSDEQPRVSKESLAKSVESFKQKDRHLVERDPLLYSDNTATTYGSIRKSASMSDIFEVEPNRLVKAKSTEYLGEPHRCMRNFFYSPSHPAYSRLHQSTRRLMFKYYYNIYRSNLDLELKPLEFKKKLNKMFRLPRKKSELIPLET